MAYFELTSIPLGLKPSNHVIMLKRYYWSIQLDNARQIENPICQTFKEK